jgi:hypothetical protein
MEEVTSIPEYRTHSGYSTYQQYFAAHGQLQHPSCNRTLCLFMCVCDLPSYIVSLTGLFHSVAMDGTARRSLVR